MAAASKSARARRNNARAASPIAPVSDPDLSYLISALSHGEESLVAWRDTLASALQELQHLRTANANRAAGQAKAAAKRRGERLSQLGFDRDRARQQRDDAMRAARNARLAFPTLEPALLKQLIGDHVYRARCHNHSASARSRRGWPMANPTIDALRAALADMESAVDSAESDADEAAEQLASARGAMLAAVAVITAAVAAVDKAVTTIRDLCDGDTIDTDAIGEALDALDTAAGTCSDLDSAAGDLESVADDIPHDEPEAPAPAAKEVQP